MAAVFFSRGNNIFTKGYGFLGKKAMAMVLVDFPNGLDRIFVCLSVLAFPFVFLRSFNFPERLEHDGAGE